MHHDIVNYERQIHTRVNLDCILGYSMQRPQTNCELRQGRVQTSPTDTAFAPSKDEA